MEKIEDHEIGPMWAEHYPKRKSHVFSKPLVLTLCKILQNKARHASATATGTTRFITS